MEGSLAREHEMPMITDQSLVKLHRICSWFAINKFIESRALEQDQNQQKTRYEHCYEVEIKYKIIVNKHQKIYDNANRLIWFMVGDWTSISQAAIV